MKNMKLIFTIIMMLGFATGLDAMKAGDAGDSKSPKKAGDAGDSKNPKADDMKKLKMVINDHPANETLIKALDDDSAEGVVDALNQGVEADLVVCDDGHVYPVLCLAAERGKANFVRALVRHKKGASLDTVCGKKKWLAGHFAAKHNRPKVIQVLAELGYPFNKKSGNDLTPLYVAVENGHADATRALIEARADSKIQCGELKFDVMHVAAQKNHARLIEIMAREYNIPVDGRDSKEFTPLHVAADYGCYKAVKALLEYANADIFAQTADGKTAIDLAREAKEEAIRNGEQTAKEIYAKIEEYLSAEADKLDRGFAVEFGELDLD